MGGWEGGLKATGDADRSRRPLGRDTASSVRRSEEHYRLSNHSIVEVRSNERQRRLCFEPTYGGCVAIGGEGNDFGRAPSKGWDGAMRWR